MKISKCAQRWLLYWNGKGCAGPGSDGQLEMLAQAAFDLPVHGCNGDFDLTLLYEEIFMVGLPCGLFLLAGASKAFVLKGSPTSKVGRYWVRDWKLVCYAECWYQRDEIESNETFRPPTWLILH